MKKTLILILTIFSINQSMAQVLKDDATPVDWSYSAVYNTFYDITKNDVSSIDVAHRIALDMYLFAQKAPRSISEICNEYQVIAKIVEATPYESLLKTHNCNDIIDKLAKKHNEQIVTISRLETIDASNRDKQVYWLTPAISYGCHALAEDWVNGHDRPYPGRELNFPEEEKDEKQYAYNVKSEGHFYRNDNEKQSAYNARYEKCIDMIPDRHDSSNNIKMSINQLEARCKDYVFASPDFYSYCTIMVSASIAHHNELVKSTQPQHGEFVHSAL